MLPRTTRRRRLRASQLRRRRRTRRIADAYRGAISSCERVVARSRRAGAVAVARCRRRTDRGGYVFLFLFFFFSKESMPRCQSPKLLCIIYEDFHSRRASTKLPHGLRNASVVCSTSARTTPRNALSDDETTPALSRYLRGVRLGACEAQAAGHLPSGEGADKSAFQRRFLALLTEAAAPHSERR